MSGGEARRGGAAENGGGRRGGEEHGRGPWGRRGRGSRPPNQAFDLVHAKLDPVTVPTLPTKHSWSLQIGFIRFNVDGAFYAEEFQGASGVVSQDDRGISWSRDQDGFHMWLICPLSC